ncbi:MAG TPA: N-acetylmuramoyl-L-alanine amidase [Thermoanaerobaculia bacterium]|nr:N-acetylmuramoyl-L-alanine amidase [Thermoanaerobaculia bacterium]
MTANDRLKRRLLAELVQENVDLLRGQLPRNRRKPGRSRLVLRIFALALLSAALLGSSRLISSLTPDQDAGSQASRGVRRSMSPAARPAAASSRVTGRLAPPQSIDPSVFPLAVRTIVLDPGHGGASIGTRTPLGLTEKDLTLDIVLRVRQLLEARSFRVLTTREADEAVDLEERAALANQAGADIFVSVHVNWIENRKARGIETYYLGPTDDPFLTQLAAAENRDSGFSLADLRQILDRIYAGVRQDNSRRLAQAVEGSLYRTLRKDNPALEDRGVKAAPFIVLLSTEMPAILAEVSCLSNEEEVRLLAQPSYRQSIAEALARGIGAYADSMAAPERKELDS